MKYEDAIGQMMSDLSTGFTHIQERDVVFKTLVLNTIHRAKCSFATARVFIGFVEGKLEKSKYIDLDTTMLEAVTFVGNGLGLDPARYSEEVTNLDIAELKMIMSASPSTSTN